MGDKAKRPAEDKVKKMAENQDNGSVVADIFNSMTEEEKKKYPSHTTCEGYLKDIPFKEAFQNAWHNLSDDNKNEFKKLPNFDSDIFFEITGVKL